jgi:hypothetical protein
VVCGTTGRCTALVGRSAPPHVYDVNIHRCFWLWCCIIIIRALFHSQCFKREEQQWW